MKHRTVPERGAHNGEKKYWGNCILCSIWMDMIQHRLPEENENLITICGSLLRSHFIEFSKLKRWENIMSDLDACTATADVSFNYFSEVCCWAWQVETTKLDHKVASSKWLLNDSAESSNWLLWLLKCTTGWYCNFFNLFTKLREDWQTFLSVSREILLVNLLDCNPSASTDRNTKWVRSAASDMKHQSFCDRCVAAEPQKLCANLVRDHFTGNLLTCFFRLGFHRHSFSVFPRPPHFSTVTRSGSAMRERRKNDATLCIIIIIFMASSFKNNVKPEQCVKNTPHTHSSVQTPLITL